MNFTDFCIYGYLAVLGVCCAIYGIVVISKGGVSQAPLHVDVGLPPDTLSVNNNTLLENLWQVDNITHGISIDLWWGFVETAPQQYDWEEYAALFNYLQATMTRPKVRVNLNFHSCSSDVCGFDAGLPTWLQTIGQEYPNIYYTDVNGNISSTYLSSGVDHINMFLPYNRSAAEMYVDFVQSFASTFKGLFDSLIYEVQIGLGPNGELRYPSFESDTWQIPGIGQFQCYDQYLQQEYLTYAAKTRPEFAFLPPLGAVSYADTPDEAPFFYKAQVNGSESAYGQFFLSWYSSRLLQHGGVILSQASSVLRTFSPNVTLAAKIGCVWWQNGDASHAAEFTAGYMNYTIITQMLQSYNVRMVFGCFDLSDRDAEQQGLVGAHPAPQQLVSEMLQTARTVGLKVEGTNSLPYNSTNLDTIISHVKKNTIPLVGFTYNYLSQDLLDNLKNFRHFVDVLNATSQK